MVLRSGLLALAVCLLGAAAVRAQSVVIQNVTVVDVSEGTLHPDQTVVVDGERIVRVAPAAEVGVPDEVAVVDGAGRYLIPGLWDMHVHAAFPGLSDTFYELLLANGIIGFRDMWGVREAGAAADAAVAAGTLAGPVRTEVPGNLVDGPARIWPGSQVALTPADGRRIVDSLHAVGAPFVKVYSSLSPETYAAIAERANELELPFLGHVPEGITVLQAAEAGQRTMEHLYGVLEACSPNEAVILEAYTASLIAIASGDSTQTRWSARGTRSQAALDAQDDALCRAFGARLGELGAWQVPTLVTLRGFPFMRENAAAGDPRLQYLPEFLTTGWFPEGNPYMAYVDEDFWTQGQARFAREMELAGLLAEGGAPILAGSDTPNPWAFPGFGLHDELELLVQAGLSPLQALQAATLNPARYYDRTDELGAVSEGFLADLVLLDANPLEDITHTRGIRAVVANGRLYRRAELDTILEDVAARSGRTTNGE